MCASCGFSRRLTFVFIFKNGFCFIFLPFGDRFPKHMLLCNLQWLSPFPIHTLVKYIKLFNPKNGTDRNNQLKLYWYLIKALNSAYAGQHIWSKMYNLSWLFLSVPFFGLNNLMYFTRVWMGKGDNHCKLQVNIFLLSGMEFHV